MLSSSIWSKFMCTLYIVFLYCGSRSVIAFHPGLAVHMGIFRSHCFHSLTCKCIKITEYKIIICIGILTHVWLLRITDSHMIVVLSPYSYIFFFNLITKHCRRNNGVINQLSLLMRITNLNYWPYQQDLKLNITLFYHIICRLIINL